MTNALHSAPALSQRLRRLWDEFERRLQSAASSGALAAAIEGALYLDSSSSAAQDYLLLLASGGVKALQTTPEVSLADEDGMAGAAGAYVGDLNRILINSDWLATASDEEVIRVLVEEYGHSLDAQFNTQDTAGDEGERFAALLLGYAPPAASSSENDTIQVTWNGQSYLAEAANLVGTGSPDTFDAREAFDTFTTGPSTPPGTVNGVNLNISRDTVRGFGPGQVDITNRNSGTVIYSPQPSSSKTVNITVNSVYSSRGVLQTFFNGASVNSGYAINIANIAGLASSPSTLSGNTGNNILTGNKANSTLNGGAGNDTLFLRNGGTANGGDGADIIQLEKGGSALGGLGNDTIRVYNKDLFTWSVDVGVATESNTVVLYATAAPLPPSLSAPAPSATSVSTFSTLATSSVSAPTVEPGKLYVRSANDIVLIPDTFGADEPFKTIVDARNTYTQLLPTLVTLTDGNYLVLSKYSKGGADYLATAVVIKDNMILHKTDLAIVFLTTAVNANDLFRFQYSIKDESYEDTNYYISSNAILADLAAFGLTDVTLALSSGQTGASKDPQDPTGNYFVYSPAANDDSAATVRFDITRNSSVIGQYSVAIDLLPLPDPIQSYRLDTTTSTLVTLQDIPTVRSTLPDGTTVNLPLSSTGGIINGNATGTDAGQIGVGNTSVDSGESIIVGPINTAYAITSISLAFKSLGQGEVALLKPTVIAENGSQYQTTIPITQSLLSGDSYSINMTQLQALNFTDNSKILGIQTFEVGAGVNSSFKLSLGVSGNQDLILGTPVADTITGTAYADQIWGFAGDDTITGGASDDLILPGSGANIIDGGAGADVLRYNRGEGGTDPFDTIGGDPTGDSIYIFDAVNVAITSNADSDTFTNDWRMNAIYSDGTSEQFGFFLPTGYGLATDPLLPPYAAAITTI